MRANLQAGHTTSSAAGDDSARHKAAIVRNVCIIGFSGLEHFERPYIRCGFYQDRPSLRVIRQFSINKKRVTIRNNARNTSFVAANWRRDRVAYPPWRRPIRSRWVS